MNETARPRGQQTQSRILERAVQIASVRGLENMSLATLAEAAQMSKSGLFAHFRSKEALQLAIVDEAERMFHDAVIAHAAGLTGMARVRALAQGYIEYMAGNVFEGGCFFAAALHEFDSRPGAVRDRLRRQVEAWHASVGDAFRAAQAAREIAGDADAFVFGLGGIGLALNLQTRVFEDRDRRRTLAHAALAALLAANAR